MEIHKPKPWHGLREFLKEYGIIVLGVLTAIALEQTVETFHRRAESAELRESLERETDQIVRDTTRVEKSMHADLDWQRQVGAILISADRTHSPLERLPPRPRLNFDIPDNPIYKAAAASGKLTLLSNDEREVYSELDGLLQKTGAAYVQREDANTAAVETLHKLRFDHSMTKPGSIQDELRLTSAFDELEGLRLPSEELKALYDTTVRTELEVGRFVYWSRQARGAAVALQRGERKLQSIEIAERQYDNLP